MMQQAMLATTLMGLFVLPLGAQGVSETPHGRELPFNMSISGDMAREVGITDSQTKQISTVFAANRNTMQELRDEVGKKEAELQTVLDAGTVDLAQAEKAVDAVLEARNRLAKTQTMMMIQMRLILTGDQWHKMADLQRKAAQAQMAANMTPLSNSGSRADMNELSAIATVRVLNTAEITFLNNYTKGYTDGLNRLGTVPGNPQPNENHADYVDKILSGFADGGTNFSFTKNGYRFTYTPGPGGFGSIKTYTVTGQPLEYGVSGKRSFYTDNMAVIHETSDNRPATVNDPSLGSTKQ
jgi:Spy/CpxP family protein refolding chaperone